MKWIEKWACGEKKSIVQIILLKEIQKSHEKGRERHCAKDKEWGLEQGRAANFALWAQLVNNYHSHSCPLFPRFLTPRAQPHKCFVSHSAQPWRSHDLQQPGSGDRGKDRNQGWESCQMICHRQRNKLSCLQLTYLNCFLPLSCFCSGAGNFCPIRCAKYQNSSLCGYRVRSL